MFMSMITSRPSFVIKGCSSLCRRLGLILIITQCVSVTFISVNDYVKELMHRVRISLIRSGFLNDCSLSCASAYSCIHHRKSLTHQHNHCSTANIDVSHTHQKLDLALFTHGLGKRVKSTCSVSMLNLLQRHGN